MSAEVGNSSDNRLRELIGRARQADGAPPFSDGALVELANGQRELAQLGDGVALVSAPRPGSETSAEFVVDPDARGHGEGGRLLTLLLHQGVSLFWAHGDHPGARALARSHGLEPVRTLLHLEAPVPAAAPPLPSVEFAPSPTLPSFKFAKIAHGEGPGWAISANSTTGGSAAGGSSAADVGGAAAAGAAGQGSYELRGFTPADADAWVELNARTFAAHPEQGRVTRADLDVLRAEPWFDPADFLLLRSGTELVGYCWLKVEGSAEGEFYVVGVSPDHQGAGIGRLLLDAGFARLAARGIPLAHLYVEGDNAPALSLYRSYGFTQRSVDIQYRAR